MKKILLCSVLAFTAMNALATDLTVEQSLARVFSKNASRGVLTSAKPSGLQYKLLSTGKMDNHNTYYVCNSLDKTWVLSANDVATPVLAVIDEPLQNIEDAPPAMKWLLSTYSEQITEARYDDISSSSTTERKNVSRSSARDYIAPLIKTKWSQREPYNTYCPTHNGVRTVTGCVATAMAQVVNYHKWPVDSIIGLPDPSSKGKLWNISIEWDKLSNSYDSETTAEEKNAVAKLMLACGASVNMKYGTSAEGGSGANTPDLGKGLVEYFNYDKGLDAFSRDFYSTEEWHDMIYNELQKGRPVLYSGSDPDGAGHQFIIDGFDNGLFDVNWGWAGLADGRYALEALNPTKTGDGAQPMAKFNTGQTAFLGVQKPQEGSVAHPYMGAYGELNLHVDYTRREIGINCTALVNLSVHTGVMQIGYLVKNKNNPAEEYLMLSSPMEIPSYYGIKGFTIGLPAHLSGNYEFTLVYKANGSDPKRFLHSPTSSDTVTVNYSTGGVTELVDPSSVNNIAGNENSDVDNIKYFDLKGNQIRKDALNNGNLYIKTQAGNNPQKMIKY